ncbi:MAG: 4Fe-4S ferredoxin, iron-sulfur binding domain protein [Bacillota bacterium]|jgi:epoxyqueuosine reductase QueG|nr:4Fe-4S ferredoxin, iron-sulfur binding domain protein [Bacillota bacterium]
MNQIQDQEIRNGEIQKIQEQLSAFIRENPHNFMEPHDDMKIYDEPLIGVSSADDPYYNAFVKPEIIGPDFLPPLEWLPGAKSVISYFLPFTKELRDTNGKPGPPSQEWISARIDGEKFNNEIRHFLVSLIEEMGFAATAPGTDPRFSVKNRVPNWSERHTAFVSGLGTFGLHRGLITEKGTAGRFGSVITTLALPPTIRKYEGYFDYCLYLTRGKCGACIKRCPADAFTSEGKDNKICSDYLDQILAEHAPRYGCAKCNVSVPCEHRIP